MLTKRNIFLQAVLGFGAVLAAVIFYMDIDHPDAYKFLIGYVLSLFAFIVYMSAAVIRAASKKKGAEIRKRAFRFIGLFISIAAGGFAIQFFLQPQSWSFYDFIYPALGVSFGIAFFDLAFYKTSKP